MMHISPTDEMPESQSLQVETPYIVAKPIYMWNPYPRVPCDFSEDCKYWSDYIDFLDERF
jgi:hypothetical protein